jgi:hypothetical protein
MYTFLWSYIRIPTAVRRQYGGTKKKRKQHSDGSEQNKKQKISPQTAVEDAGTSVKPGQNKNLKNKPQAATTDAGTSVKPSNLL